MERLDILDKEGNRTGQTKTIAETHRDGDWHLSAHVWFLNSRGEILLQKRSGKSHLMPGHWDSSAAGHVAAGGESLEYAVKEAEEELGIKLVPGQLEFLGRVAQEYKAESKLYGETYRHNDFSDIYLVRMDIGPKDIKFTDGEVEEVKWVPWPTLAQWVKEKKPDLVPHPEEYMLLFEKIKNLK